MCTLFPESEWHERNGFDRSIALGRRAKMSILHARVCRAEPSDRTRAPRTDLGRCQILGVRERDMLAVETGPSRAFPAQSHETEKSQKIPRQISRGSVADR